MKMESPSAAGVICFCMTVIVKLVIRIAMVVIADQNEGGLND
jgi:hypothetical protein